MPLERRLDLARLDPEAADLDLTVGAAEELDVPLGSQRARSPVRYRRASGSSENGLGTNRSAVSSGRLR